MTHRFAQLLVVAGLGAALAAVPGCFGDDSDDLPGGGGGACDESGGGYWDAEWAELECEVLELVNEARAAGADCGGQGSFGSTGPLVMQDQLREAARFHSEWMGTNDIFDHDSPGGPNGDTWIDRIVNAGYSDYTVIAENIAAGSSTAADVMEQWMSSDGHCANIMDPVFEEVGIGYAEVGGSTYGHYWTMDLGAR
jgi:uncharacterized protein YkwD